MNSLGNAIVKVLIIAGLAATSAVAADRGNFPTTPITNDGKKWRIAYYEGGEYIDYQKVLTETVRGLMGLGWIETSEIPPQTGEQTLDLWRWLAEDVESDYIEFVAGAHYSANWDDELRIKMVARIMKRLHERDDIDLLIAMGTWSGKDFANDRHDTPTMVLSASDPLSAGIIDSVEDSGFGHLHATVDPHRFERQVTVFHEIIGFKKLGIAYEDSIDGRSYGAIDVLERLTKERDFDLVRCHTQSDIADTAVAEKSVVDCFEQLVETADAIYVTQQGGINRRSISALVNTANEHDVPTFSQAGSEEVRYGFLASLSQAGFRYVGESHATTFAKVFNGARPNDLDQLFEEPPKIAINLRTAELIGFNPPVVLLGAADEIFDEIEMPE